MSGAARVARLLQLARAGDAEAALGLRRHALRSGDPVLFEEMSALRLRHALAALHEGRLAPETLSCGGRLREVLFEPTARWAWIVPHGAGSYLLDLVRREVRPMPRLPRQTSSQPLLGTPEAAFCGEHGWLATCGRRGNEVLVLSAAGPSLDNIVDSWTWGSDVRLAFDPAGERLAIASLDRHNHPRDPPPLRSVLAMYQHRPSGGWEFAWPHPLAGQLTALAFAAPDQMVVATRPFVRRGGDELEGRFGLSLLRLLQHLPRPTEPLVLDFALATEPPGGVLPESELRRIQVVGHRGVAVEPHTRHVLGFTLSPEGPLTDAHWLADATAAALSPDGQWLALGLGAGEQSALEIRASATAEAVARLELPGGPMIGLCWSAEHELLAATADGTLWTWPLWLAIEDSVG